VYNLYTLLSSDLILPFYGIYTIEDTTYLIAKLASYGNLLDLFQSKKDQETLTLSKKLCLSIFVANAVKSIHDKNYCKGYLSSVDVLINNPADDLEQAEYYFHYLLYSQQSETEESEELLPLLAPELQALIKDSPLTSEHWTTSGDIYSFGNFLWELYQETTISEVEQDENGENHIPEECPWGSIIEQCWNQDPERRPTIDTVASQLEELKVMLKSVLKCSC